MKRGKAGVSNRSSYSEQLDKTNVSECARVASLEMNLQTRLNDQLTFVAFRAIKSLLKCRAEGFSDVKLKAVTGINIVKKVFNNIPVKTRVDFTPWIFKDTIVRVNFRGIEYMFYCLFQCDSNIFLNPYYHEYDVPLITTTLLHRGDTFVDVGAHCGLYTLLAGKMVGKEGAVIAIEPIPLNVELLNLNLRLNNLSNVLVVPKAAGKNHLKTRICFEKEKTAFSSALSQTGNVIDVETTQLDEVAEAQGSIRLLKIDTEGSDLDVLKGAEETLCKTSYLVVEQTDPEVKRLLLKHDFDIFLLSASRNLLAVKKKVRVDRVLRKLTSMVGPAW